MRVRVCVCMCVCVCVRWCVCVCVCVDMRKFQAEGGHVIIGTPGRLEDIINKMDHVFNTRSLEVLVLDEADRLLEMGFRPQINTILNRLPKQRRTVRTTPIGPALHHSLTAVLTPIHDTPTTRHGCVNRASFLRPRRKRWSTSPEPACAIRCVSESKCGPRARRSRTRRFP